MPLELLLPDARAGGVLVLGSACPPHVAGGVPRASAGCPADLVVVAPARDEAASTGWMSEAARTAAASVTPGGLVYALIPPRRRRQFRRLLRREGLGLCNAFLHLPDVATSRFVLPLEHAPASYALGHVLETQPWKRALARLVVRLRALALAGLVLEPVALAARARTAPPLYAWLDRAVGAESGGVIAVSRAARSARPAVALLHFRRGDPGPTAVAKVRLRPEDRETLAREASVLAELGPTAQHAGAEVPKVIDSLEVGGRLVLLESVIAAPRASSVLAFGPERLEDVLGRIASWLDRWARLTALPTELDEARLRAAVCAPAEVLTAQIPEGDAYLSWLQSACERLAGTTTPLVAAHNDLTMSNVLLRGDGRIGVVDWESATARSFPLLDYFYGAADAVAAATAYADRPAAFAAAFSEGGRRRPLVVSLRDRLASGLGLSEAFVELCFHACWLHHARNEHVSGHPPDRPFLAIVRRVSRWTIRTDPFPQSASEISA